MAAANILLVFVAIFVINLKNVQNAKLSARETCKNVNTIETVNNVVNDLINQTTFIMKASQANTAFGERVNQTPSTLMTERVNDRVDKQRNGFLGMWSRESVTIPTTTTDTNADSQEDEDDEEEDSTSSETEPMSDLRNESSADLANSHQDLPDIRFSINIGHNDAFSLQDLAQTIEKLREFNDKYERLIEENKSIRRELQELRYKSNTQTTQQSDDTTFMSETTTGEFIDSLENSISDTKTTKKENHLGKSRDDDLINGIRANLMI